MISASAGAVESQQRICLTMDVRVLKNSILLRMGLVSPYCAMIIYVEAGDWGSAIREDRVVAWVAVPGAAAGIMISIVFSLFLFGRIRSGRAGDGASLRRLESLSVLSALAITVLGAFLAFSASSVLAAAVTGMFAVLLYRTRPSARLKAVLAPEAGERASGLSDAGVGEPRGGGG